MSKIHLFVHLYSRFIFVGRVESGINRLSAFISQAQNCFHIEVECLFRVTSSFDDILRLNVLA